MNNSRINGTLSRRNYSCDARRYAGNITDFDRISPREIMKNGIFSALEALAAKRNYSRMKPDGIGFSDNRVTAFVAYGSRLKTPDALTMLQAYCAY